MELDPTYFHTLSVYGPSRQAIPYRRLSLLRTVKNSLGPSQGLGFGVCGMECSLQGLGLGLTSNPPKKYNGDYIRSVGTRLSARLRLTAKELSTCLAASWCAGSRRRCDVLVGVRKPYIYIYIYKPLSRKP